MMGGCIDALWPQTQSGFGLDMLFPFIPQSICARCQSFVTQRTQRRLGILDCNVVFLKRPEPSDKLISGNALGMSF